MIDESELNKRISQLISQEVESRVQQWLEKIRGFDFSSHYSELLKENQRLKAILGEQ